MATGGKREKISTAQNNAIAALLTSRDIKTAAEKASIPERTLHRWIDEDPLFQAALKTAEEQAIGEAVRRLTGLTNSALDVLVMIMADKSHAAGVRVRAASQILDIAVRWRELYSVERRLAALEGLNNGTN